MQKLTMHENWGVYCTPQTENEKQQAAASAAAVKEAVNAFIFENLANLEVRFVTEEGEMESSLSELEMAVSLASTPELQLFLKEGCVPFDGGTIVTSLSKRNTAKTLALCEGRHEMPAVVEGAIFGNSINPLDVEGLEKVASEKLADVQELTLYVTGLTVALVAVINVCHEKGIKLTLMHFDRVAGNYYQQVIK